MPGTVILTGKLMDYRDDVVKAIHTLYDTLGIEHRVNNLLEKNNLVYMSLEYPGYPIYIRELDREILFIDGRIYSETTEDVISKILSGEKSIWDIGYEIDGDYILGKISPDKATIVNDPSANLTLHYYVNKDGYAISRIPYILEAVFGRRLDMDWVIETLMYEHQFNGHTAMNEVRKMGPGRILVISDREYSEREYWRQTYDPRIGCEMDWAAREFLNLSRRRVNTFCRENIRKFIVNLSGGLDSRMVLAGLLRARDEICDDIDIIARTYKSPRIDSYEVAIAGEVAEILDVKHVIVKRDKPNGKIELLRRYLSINPPQSEVVVSGAGGDKVIKPSGHIKEEIPRERDRAIAWILSLPYYSFKEVKEMIGAEDPREIIISELAKYPEKTGAGMFARYFVEGRVANWLVGDKNTPWMLTPFMSNPFLPRTIRMKPICKEYFRLCRKIIEYLNPRLIKIPYYNIRISLSGPFSLLPLKIRLGYYYTGAIKILRGQRGDTVPSREFMETLYREYEEIRDIIYGGARKISSNSSKINEYLEKYIIGSAKDARNYFKIRRAFKTFTRVGIIEKIKGRIY